jgi:hypothetical protein
MDFSTCQLLKAATHAEGGTSDTTDSWEDRQTDGKLFFLTSLLGWSETELKKQVSRATNC